MNNFPFLFPLRTLMMILKPLRHQKERKKEKRRVKILNDLADLQRMIPYLPKAVNPASPKGVDTFLLGLNGLSCSL